MVKFSNPCTIFSGIKTFIMQGSIWTLVKLFKRVQTNCDDWKLWKCKWSSRKYLELTLEDKYFHFYSPIFPLPSSPWVKETVVEIGLDWNLRKAKPLQYPKIDKNVKMDKSLAEVVNAFTKSLEILMLFCMMMTIYYLHPSYRTQPIFATLFWKTKLLLLQQHP